VVVLTLLSLLPQACARKTNDNPSGAALFAEMPVNFMSLFPYNKRKYTPS
jgi:hypothetical protein